MSVFTFASDLHGRIDRYEKLFNYILTNKPGCLLLGGDLLPNMNVKYFYSDFIRDYLLVSFSNIKEKLGDEYPLVLTILGNDDPGEKVEAMLYGEESGLWNYIHNKKIYVDNFTVYGYSFVPPTPFLLKDWEKFDLDVSVNPGCIPPTQGTRTVKVSMEKISKSTIKEDLYNLTNDENLENTIMLFHTPPYNTNLDMADNNGKIIENGSSITHVGSQAVRDFIEDKQPLITLHGHIHESSTLTGSWKDNIDDTYCFTAAYDRKELALITFSPEKPDSAQRLLL
jgi:uncharacterized protein